MERFAIKIDKNLRANLYKICRLCGIDNPEKVKVLDDETTVNLEDGEPELWKKVLDCIGLMITKDDKMPQFMCTLCVDKINDFFEFREMCYATDGQTRKLLGIKEEPKLKNPTRASTSSVNCKTEEQDRKLPIVSAAKPGRKRRNADMEICNTSMEIKTDEFDDVKPATTSTYSSKKKRLRLDTPETDIKPGSVAKRLKIDSTAKDKKDTKPAKIAKLMRKQLKVEGSALAAQKGRNPLPLQIQRKKNALELIKQRKLGKKVPVVKVDKPRQGSSEAKIKEEAPVPAPTPTQPKVKLKDKCAICSESFVNKTLLDKHIKSTHIPAVVRYHCVKCNETLKKNMEIKNHNLWHKLSKTPFICGNCSESSCSIYTYSKHIRDCGQVSYLDTHIPDWHCPECSGIFETTYLFNIHPCVSNRLICPGCDRSLKWKEDFLKHIPTCPAAIHRIPPYMSSNIQVKNEAEHPISPIPQQYTHSIQTTASKAVQQPPPSRVTPPLMNINQCVVIPGNANLLEESSSPSSKSKKSKRITKKDLKRFDKLLKSTMTTLVSIKQEPIQGDTGDGEQSSSSDVRQISESPPGSPPPGGDEFHQNDDDDTSADEQTSAQPAGTIKQEIIDEGYRDLYNNIEVNIKREVLVHQNRNTDVGITKKKKGEDATEVVSQTESIAPKPVLKLKITKEHGMLNSILVDSPKSEKKKKKKKRKEERCKAAEREEANDVQQVAIDDAHGPNVADSEEAEPTMPLPEIICIKKEITELEEEEFEERFSSQSNHSTPSIVAAACGSLQISCVSEGVYFNNADENDDAVGEETTEPEGEQESDVQMPEICEEPQEELDIKPRLEDLIPMLQIGSISSGEDLMKKQSKTPTKRRRQIAVMSTPSTSTPQIISVSSGSAVAAFQSEPESSDNNENFFDYTQIRIKEELIDPNYGEMPQEEVEQEENVAAEAENAITKKQTEENVFIANIDFNNLNIKQEKEYIDDGLDNAAGFEDDDRSDSDSEISSDSEDNDSESEREYRDLPSEDDNFDSNEVLVAPVLTPFGLKISEVHSEFTYPQPNEKTESKLGETLPEHNTKSNATTKCKNLQILKANTHERDHVCDEIASKGDIDTKPVESKEKEETSGSSIETILEKPKDHFNIPMEIDGEVTNQPSTSTVRISEVRSIYQPQSSSETNVGIDDVAVINRLQDKVQSYNALECLNDRSSTQTKLKPVTNEFGWNCYRANPVTHTSIGDAISPSTSNASSGPGNSSYKPTQLVQSLTSSPMSISQDVDVNLSTLNTKQNRSGFLVTDETDLLPLDDEKLTPVIDAVSASEIDMCEEPQHLSDINRPVVQDQYLTQPLLTSDIGMCPINTSAGLSVSSKLIDQVPSTITQDVKSINNVPSSKKTLPGDDFSMGDIEPVVRQTDPTPSYSMTQDECVLLSSEIVPTLIGFPSSSNTISHNPKALITPKIGQYINDRLQTSVATTNYGSHNMVPSLSTVNKEKDILLLPSSVESINNRQLPNIHIASSCSMQDKESGNNDAPTATSSNNNFKDIKPQIVSIQPAEPDCSGERSDHLQFTSQSKRISLDSYIDSTMPLDSASHHAGTSTNEVGISTELRDVLSNSVFDAAEPVLSPKSSNDDINLNCTEPYKSTSSLANLTEFEVDLNIPTAGQLHTLNLPEISQITAASSISLDINPDLRIPVLSEEVQNILNEDTVAANNFELNEGIFRTRCSTSSNAYSVSPPVIPSNFRDLENVNEIAENNNNANIERELQDELGNVLAAAIADRSLNDEADENNIMNENRANLDIT